MSVVYDSGVESHDVPQVNITVGDQETKKDKYWDAPEVKEIAQKLLGTGGEFTFPLSTPILYLFVDKMKDWGTCAHCSEKVNFACGYEFIITINHAVWSVLDERTREALVFHELCHIFYDPLKDKYALFDHDVEEFGRVIARYGLWTDSVKRFMDAGIKAITLADVPDEQVGGR